jgi:hypothetical protein
VAWAVWAAAWVCNYLLIDLPQKAASEETPEPSFFDGILAMPQRRTSSITSRVIRPPATEPVENDGLDYSLAERIEAVWTLTKASMQWNADSSDEPRPQRTITRIQRPQR